MKQKISLTAEDGSVPPLIPGPSKRKKRLWRFLFGGPAASVAYVFCASRKLAFKKRCLPLRSDVSRRENDRSGRFLLLTGLSPSSRGRRRAAAHPGSVKKEKAPLALPFWWTWRESNPCPKNRSYNFLRGQFVVWISLAARRQTDLH